MKITLLRTFQTNIGNAFIDKGARQTIENAFPNAEIAEVSGYPLYASHRSSISSLRTLADLAGWTEQGVPLPTQKDRQFLHLGQFLDADIAVFPGCVLYPRLLEYFSPALSDLNERDIPIVFLGAGGYFYDPDHRNTKRTRDYLDRLSSTALISRDEPCYETFNDLFDYASPGIDNAFFIDEWHQPPESNQEFDVHTFDNQAEPDIQTERRVLRASHMPFGYGMPFGPSLQAIKARIQKYRSGLYESDNLLVSELPEDYLFLYANGYQTHSSRVHACVPALVYGNEAQFYKETPRGSLFEQVLDEDISQRPVRLPRDVLNQKKSEQVEKLKTAVDALT